ncbi:MAG: GNAT family N-acetyltransferase [Spirochaetes bacterium]|nr:GNAT family N-acetyltransferase [Spirochaetota bacterium]
MMIKEMKGTPDYREIIDLIDAEWPHQFGNLSNDEKIKELQKGHNNQTDTLKFLYHQNKIIGFYRYSLFPRDNPQTTTAHIFDIAILPEWQGKKLGKMLMKDMIQDCQEKGFEKLLSRSFKDNVGSIKLHQSLGFSVHLETEDSIVWEIKL